MRSPQSRWGSDLEKFPALDDWLRPIRRRRRRAIASQLFLCVVVVWALYLFLTPVDTPEQWELSTHPLQNTDTADPVSPAPEEMPTIPQENTALSDQSEDVEDEDEDESNDELPRWQESTLATSLANLFSTLPDKVQIANLLRPLDSTGEARLHDLGKRTRYYKMMFEAWENVHLVLNDNKNALHIRDGVVQYVQQHSDVATNLGMSVAEIVRSYETYRSVFTQLSTLLFPWTAPYYPDHTHLHAQFYGAGKGIVFLAGNGQAPFLLTSIPVIRALGCDLPVEVFYLGDQDLSESMRAQLESLPGVTTHDISKRVNDEGWTLAGWAGKPFAILFSSFREVILIDADSLFFQNPEILFEDESYRETGALFFKDRIIMPQTKRQWLQKVLPAPISEKVYENRLWTGASSHMQESGVVVVDTWRHFVALLLVTRMNGPDRDSDEDKHIVGVYGMVYGDKETFWLGWELVGDTDYAFHEGDAGTMGVLEKPGSEFIPSTDGTAEASDADPEGREPDSYTICTPQILHLDLDGRPLWFNGWVVANKYDQNERKPGVFDVFLREPRTKKTPDQWQLHQINMCCLTSEYMSNFTADEREIIDMIIANGRKVGVLDEDNI
ncbi:mannosyltransferase putative-domain-containing protein [Aspergillus crustosus]